MGREYTLKKEKNGVEISASLTTQILTITIYKWFDYKSFDPEFDSSTECAGCGEVYEMPWALSELVSQLLNL